MSTDQLYYSLTPLLRKKRSINMIVGSRGHGKSYSLKMYCLDRFINKGKKFIWIRRYKEQARETVDKFLSDIQPELMKRYPNNKIRTQKTPKGGKIFVDDKIAGEVWCLTASETMKSISWHEYDTLVYDEFLTIIRPLPNETTLFIDLMETVFRDRSGWKCFLVSNAITSTSKYFEIFGIKPVKNQRFISNQHTCLELDADPNWILHKKDGVLFQAINDSNYTSYAVENQFLLDNEEGVSIPIGNHKEMFTIKTNNLILGVWEVGSHIFISERYNPQNRFKFTWIKEKTTSGYRFIDGTSYPSLLINKAISDGSIRYSTLIVKQEVLETIKTIITSFY